MDRLTDRVTDRLTDRVTDRWTDRVTDRWTDCVTDTRAGAGQQKETKEGRSRVRECFL